MGNALATVQAPPQELSSTLLEEVLIIGDLKVLNGKERIEYYGALCKSLGLNPLSKPFDYIQLNGKLTLYAKKDCTDQLRSGRNISIKIVGRDVIDDVYVVTARAWMQNGREDEATGAVAIAGLKGEAKANAMMKAETKAKRRVTLSLAGLGFTDETEIESISAAQRVQVDSTTGEIIGDQPKQIEAPKPAAAPKAAAPAPVAPPTPAPAAPPPAPKPATGATGDEHIDQTLGSMRDKFSAMKVFQTLKKDVAELVGSDRPYYEILLKHGVQHCDQFKSLNPSKACAKDLILYLRRVQASNTPPTENGIDDSDIPFELGGTYVGGPNPAEAITDEIKQRVRDEAEAMRNAEVAA